MVYSRKYTQEQYDDAIKRISKLIDITNIKNINELDNRLKKEDVYYDAKGGLGTIYDQLIENWRQHVEPEQLIKQELQIIKRKKLPRISQNKIRKQKREMNRLNGESYYREENKIKIRKVKGEVRQYILHKGRYHKLDNIIIYQRTFIKNKEISQKWFTRKKPKRAKSVKKQ